VTTTERLFCTECGTVIPEEAKFCQGCGQPVRAGAAVLPTGAPKKKALRAWWRRRGGWKWWIIGLVVLIVVAVMLRRKPETVEARSVACYAAGSCVAVGWYEDNSRQFQAMIVSETHGVWGEASEVTLPANASSKPRAYLESVACTASRSCVAVGRYTDSSGNAEAMSLSETHGVWGGATEVTLPANARTR
jgi:hypothetical protein